MSEPAAAVVPAEPAWLAASAVLGGMLILLHLLGIVPRSRKILALAWGSLAVMRDRSLDDAAKERALQTQAGQLAKHGGLLVLVLAGAIGLPIAGLWLVVRMDWCSWDGAAAASVSPIFLGIAGLISVALLWPRQRVGYAWGDRVLHRMAFRARGVQIALADLDDAMAGRRLRELPLDRPVFISGLPRAGTTLLLEQVVAAGGFGSHLYRDMPFVLTPWLWNRLGGGTRQVPRHERAHGDGMDIDLNSPEALEEVVWLPFWRNRYLSDRIRTWDPAKAHPEFLAFFTRHLRKIALLRGATRYCSKNNLTIARTGWIRRHVPEAVLIIPFRTPLHHASSLLEQHRNFLDLHQRDRFAREYMRAIGHFDFGDNLAPVDFDGWWEGRQHRDPLQLGFWLEYWVAAYAHLLEQGRGPAAPLHFLSYEALCSQPQVWLERVAGWVQHPAPVALIAQGAGLRPPRERAIDTSGISPALLGRAQDLHASLLTAAGG